MNLLTVKQVAEQLSCSRAFVYRLAKSDASFPKSMSIGMGEESQRGVRWVAEELKEWLLTRKQKEVKPNENGRDSQDVHKSTGEEVAA